MVTRDVPPYAIVAGNPARLVRYRFDQTVIARLLKSRWWDWSPQRIARDLPLLVGADPAPPGIAAPDAHLHEPG